MNSNDLHTEFYVLPLIAGALAGYIIGQWMGIGGVAGLLIGAFIVDALHQLRGTRRLAAELDTCIRDTVELLKRRLHTPRHTEKVVGPQE